MMGVVRLPAFGVRVWRLVALVWAFALIRFSAPESTPLAPSESFQLAEALAFFPEAQSVEPLPGGGSRVFSGGGEDRKALGCLLSTSPEGDRVIGYSGPSRLVVALDSKGLLVGTRLLSSADTPAHVQAVRQAGAFWRQLQGWNPAKDPPPRVEAVAGSTLTSLALVEILQTRFTGKRLSLRFPEPVGLEEVRRFFPEAASMAPGRVSPDALEALDLAGHRLGWLFRSAPDSDAVSGYAGPSETLIAVEADGQTVRRVELRKSFDTEEYVERVRKDRAFWSLLTRWKVAQWPQVDFEKEGVEGVAGATLTSFAVAEGLKRRMTALGQSGSSAGGWRAFLKARDARDWALIALLIGACCMSFSALRGIRWVRWSWQAILVGGLGLGLGQFVSIGLLVGWARSGVPWSSAPALVAMGLLALGVPWGTRRQIYCHQLCPHGAAQEWMGRFPSLHRSIPVGGHRILEAIPGLILVAIFLGALWLPELDFGQLEPFDAWILGGAAVVPACLAVLGLGASLFVPQAYCRYGCPTGALLRYVRSASQSERLGLRDGAVAVLLTLASLGLLWSHLARSPLPTTIPPVSISSPGDEAQAKELRGRALGTGWSVRFRSALPAPLREELRGSIEAELERLESTLSPWRAESATRQWNESATTLEMEVPEELFRLIQHGLGLSEKTAGAYDVTLAPLISAWGFGPEGPVERAPTAAQIQDQLAHVGWQKILLGSDGRSLRKTDPAVRVMVPLLQGYAVDRLFELLQGKVGEFLLELGGELRAAGRWRVGIEDPAAPERQIRELDLENEALATSGLYRSRRSLEGHEISHVISPRTGRPVETPVELCSVRAFSCLEAKGAAQAMLCLLPKDAGELARREGWVSFRVLRGGEFLESGSWSWVGAAPK
jgi:NosR/NirI family nitrous oxide reductase transcriptional regulator